MKTEYDLMEEIIDYLEINNKFSRTTTEEKQHAVNKMVRYKIVAHQGTVHGSTYTRGEHFLEAKLKGAQKFIESVDKKVNPPLWTERWEYFSNNPLLAGIGGGVIGGIGVQLFIYILS